jgi:hypothetical protein
MGYYDNVNEDLLRSNDQFNAGPFSAAGNGCVAPISIAGVGITGFTIGVKRSLALLKTGIRY